MTDDAIIPLTENEYAVLMICAEGGSLADLGENSRWSGPIQSLVKRGFLYQHDQFNNVITVAGREALGEYQNQEARDLINLNNAMVIKKRDAMIAAAPYGASVVNGKLFFKLLDGSTVTCECIGEPYVSKIVEACRVGADDN